jgi:hypothetical protein
MARFRFSFWLDCKKDDELVVAETIDGLKRQRNFSGVVRDGIMIVNELRQGKVDLLLKLYPWVADAIQPQIPVAVNEVDLRSQIEDLKQIILKQGAITAPPNYSMLKQPASAPVATVTSASLADASTISDNFLACFQ